MAATVSAQSNSVPSRSLSLDESIQMAVEHNFDVQIERYNPRLSLYSLRASYAGYDPLFSVSGQHDFSLSGGGLDPVTKLPSPPSQSDDNRFDSSVTGGLLPWGTTYNLSGNIQETYGFTPTSLGTNAFFDNTRGKASITLSQPLLKNFWIDNTRLNISVAKNRLKYSEQGLRRRLMDTIQLVERAYYDLIAARENVKVQEQALQLADRLLAENKRRVEVGALAPLDEKQAASQVAARRADLQTAQAQLATAQNTLKSRISDQYRDLHDTDLDPTESLASPLQIFNLQDSWGKGMTLRPELLQAKLDLERSGVQLRYDKNQLFPQLDLFGTYGHSAGGTAVEFSDGFDQLRQGSQPSYTYGARLSVPLSNVGARNAYKSSKEALQQSLLIVKKTEQDIMVEIDNAVIAARTSYERVGSTREATLYAEAALEAEQKKLENGKSTSFVVLQLQRDLTAARSAEISALADYNKSLADLARSEGSTLERRNIDVNVK
jgi:outer membrane protein TolC